MNVETSYEQANQLADFIASKHFSPEEKRIPYYHMGATITDTVLQSGLNYKKIVYPRVQKLIYKYPYCRTTSDFIILMQTIPTERIIGVNNRRKISLVQEISWLLFENNIETENALASWLGTNKNESQLTSLKGFGPKSLDYMKMLSGYPSIAIDRHLFHFLKLAGIEINTYQEASKLYKLTAEILRMGEYELDRQIWKYMSMTASDC